MRMKRLKEWSRGRIPEFASKKSEDRQ